MRHQKRIWLIIVLNILLWLGFGSLITKVSPDYIYVLRVTNYVLLIPLTQIAFFLVLTPALTLTLGLIFSSTKRGFALSLGISLFLLLKMLQAVNWLNILILVILVIVMLLA